MAKKRIIFMGEKPLGLKCLNLLESLPDVVLLGVCTRSRRDVWWGTHELLDYCEAKMIPVISRSQILDYSVDHLISILYPFIVENKYIQHALKKSFNIHEAPLPRWRGCNGYSHAIMLGDQEYGTTLHEIVAELDAGMIVSERRFPIMPYETAKELYERTSEESYRLAQQWFPRIIQENYTPYSWDEGEESFLNQRDSLANLKKTDLGTPIMDVFQKVRALDFVPWEPAFILTGNRKFYLFIGDALERDGIKKWDNCVRIPPVRCLNDIDFEIFDFGIIEDLPRPMLICGSGIYKHYFQMIGEMVNSDDAV